MPEQKNVTFKSKVQIVLKTNLKNTELHFASYEL